MDKELSDRELLELAAKAAGYDTSHPMNRERLSLNPPVNALWVSKGGELVHTGWDPLEDDGLALRLAVRLGLRILTPDEDDPVAVVRDWTGARVAEEGEPCAATRRAIVRCAAEIGKGVA